VKTGKPSIYRIKGFKARDAEITMNVASTVKRIARLAKSYRKPSSLQINILTSKFTDDHLVLALKHLKKLTYLKNLSIQAPNLSSVTWKGYRLLTKMTTLKHLQKIDFNTSNCEHVGNQFLSILTRLIFKASTLKDIKLDLHQDAFLFQSIDDFGVSILRRGLRKLYCLQDLKLNLAGCLDISDQSLTHIYFALKSSRQLLGLSLNFSRDKKIRDSCFKDLGNLLGMKSALKKLELNFSRCELITDLALLTLEQKCLEKEYHFESFTLNFSGCHDVTDNGAKIISDLLKESQKSLTEISLNFHKQHVTNKTISDISKTLTQFQSVKTLDLNFALCDFINDDGLEQLRWAISALKQLRNYRVDFRGCSKLSDRGIERLCQGFDELNQLTNLSLNFSWTDNISNVSLEYLRKSLEKQIHLKSLSFDFHSLSSSSSNSSGVSDVGVGFLSSALAKLTNLTFLSFNMEKCKVADESLYHLKEAIVHLQHLHTFKLNVNRCVNVTHRGIHHLEKSFVKLKNLRLIELSLLQCNAILPVGIYRLENAITDPVKLIIHR